MTGENKSEKKMRPIWFWVGLVLITYGLIIGGMGIYYIFYPDTKTVLGHLNPSLWWGGVLLVTGLIFYFVSLKSSAD